MAKLSPYGPFRAFDSDGNPLSGGFLFAYEAGTTTPKVTYIDAAQSAQNAFPIVLDANGYANVWLGDGAYKLILKDAQGVQLWSIDDVSGDAINTFGNSIVDVPTNLSVTTAHENALLNCTAAVTLSFLAAATAGNGYVVSVRNSSTGFVTIDPDGSETVNNEATIRLYPGQSCILICTGAGWLTLGFAGIMATTSKSANYSPALSDRGKTILVDATSGAITISPLSASSAGDGFELIVKKVDSSTNAVTIDFNGSETGDGQSTIVLEAQNDAIILVSNGLNWIIKSRYRPTTPDPTIQKFTSGSGTYTTPAGCKRIRVRMVGGGGGGGGNGSGAGNGGNGGDTTFGSSFLTAGGGAGGAAGGGGGGAGGSPTIAAGPLGVGMAGSAGGSGGFNGSSGIAQIAGGTGGSSAFGGSGRGGPGVSASANAGSAGATNSGSGGGGAGNSNVASMGSGGGGGSGAFIDVIINSPSATYAYSVGAAGTAGTAGTSGAAGGAGAAGFIIVEEFYA